MSTCIMPCLQNNKRKHNQSDQFRHVVYQKVIGIVRLMWARKILDFFENKAYLYD